MRPTTTHASTLRDYLQIARRRKWIIATVAILIPALALGYSLREPKQFEGSAQVLLSQQDLANQLTGTPIYNNTPADREAQTQADLARVPGVAQRAIADSGSSLTVREFLARSAVSAGLNADLLTFTFTDHDPDVARRLATEYARAYVRYRLTVDTAPINSALREVESEVRQLSEKGSLYNTLEEKATQLRTLAALKTANASVVRVSQQAVQTAPRTVRNLAIGFVLGLLFGFGFGFVWESLDTRVRSADGVSEQLHLPLLARLAEPPRNLRNANHLVMVDDPAGIHAESFRMLRVNVEFASLGKEARTLMVTSGTEQEGKSTTIANLAVAFAKAGQHVVLVDLDLRRPFIDRFFNLEGRPGITQVAIGAAALGDAIVRIPVMDDAGLPMGGHSNGNGGHRRVTLGALDVLPSGPIPPDPGEFVGAARLTEILSHLSNHCDIVLVDAPPLFHVGDALTLSAKVDAVLVVANLQKMRRPMLSELKRQLDTMPSHKLGFILTGAQAEESYGGYGYGHYARPYLQEAAGSKS